ncbi:MAG: amidohydrolase family protein [Dehalococcoidia bacterium]
MQRTKLVGRIRIGALGLLAAPAILGAIACAGEAGAVGPAGPAGPPGPPGPAASAEAAASLVATGAVLDVHTHLASQALTDQYAGPGLPPSTADDLVARLDEGNVQRAVVLSGGYMGWPIGLTDDHNMAPENDFVSDEVSKYPDRLIGFCGINPLFDSAVREVERCLELPGMVGVKIHMAGSGIDMTDPEQVGALSAVFDAAQAHDAPMLVHVGTEYGLEIDSEGFTNFAGVVDEHPDVRITYAHCAGPRDDQGIEAWIRNALVTENSFVDTSACLAYFKDAPMSQRELIVWRFRQWGIDRVLYGSDYLMADPAETPQEAIDTLLQYPFTQAELDTILGNDGSAWLGR